MADLSEFRQKIDQLDEEILQLLNQRAKMVAKIGEVKKEVGCPIVDVHRELGILKHLLSINTGPLKKSHIHRIFREIFVQSKKLQQKPSQSFELQKKITIVGMGLMGGSLYKAIRRYHPSCQLRAFDRHPHSEWTSCTFSEIFDSDYIFLAMPVQSIQDFLRENASLFMSNSTVVDLGSTKEQIVKMAKSCLPQDVVFVGGHPLVGKELSGFQHSDEDLFLGHPFVLTPAQKQQVPPQLVNLLEGIGSHVIFTDAHNHDLHLAYYSHLPHLISLSLALTVAKNPSLSRQEMIPRSLKEMVRIAGAHFSIWNDIYNDNKEPIKKALSDFQTILNSVVENLENLSKEYKLAHEFVQSLQKESGDDRSNEKEPHKQSVA